MPVFAQVAVVPLSVSGAAICHHHLSTGQDDALRIADRRPTWRRSDAGPFVARRIVDCAKRSPDRTAIVIFAAHDYDLSIWKHGGGEVERVVSARQCAGAFPRAVDIAAGCVGHQSVPGICVIGEKETVHQNGTVGEQYSVGNRRRRWCARRGPCSCSEWFLGAGDAGPNQRH